MTSSGAEPHDDALRELLGRHPAQVFGPHVVVTHLTPVEAVALADVPSVASVHFGPVPTDAPLPEDATGRAAVAAWNSRREGPAKATRYGEGKAWDDPGYEREGHPPDG